MPNDACVEQMDQESLPPEKNALFNEPTDKERIGRTRRIGRTTAQKLNANHSSKQPTSDKPNKELVPKNSSHSNEIAMDSSIMNDNSHHDNDETGESDSEEETYKMTLIDENDTKRFIFIRENASVKLKTVTEPMTIGKKKVILSGNMQATLELSDVMELYEQDIDSVAKEMKERNSFEYGKERSDYGKIMGKLLYTSTSTQFSTKASTSKFNTKPESTMV